MKEIRGFSAENQRFQAKDVFRFGSNQLVQAKTGDGTVVYVQEIPLRKPLPPGADSALRVDLRHVPSILDVLFEKKRVKLIHPPLRGEPLSEIAPLEPVPALEICRKLLFTLEELGEQSPPLSSTCDPRNVYLENGEPYFLFLWIKGYTEPPEEKWRELLFFLLTGEFPKEGEAPEKAVVHERIPEPLRPLVADSLNPKHSRKEILKRVQEELLRMKREQEPPSKHTSVHPRMRRKKGLLAAALSLALLVGGIYGIWTFSKDSQAKERNVRLDEMQRTGITFDDRRQEYVWPEMIQGASLIRGSFIPLKGQPFSVMLANREYRNSYGFSVDEGRLVVLMSSPEIWYSLVDSEGMFSVQEGSVYNFEIIYIPDKPIRYSVWKQDDTRRWVAVGNVPAEKNFQIRFQGGEGTKLLRSEVIAYSERMYEKSPWQLSQGSALIQGDRWKMGRSSRVRADAAPYSFRFLRPEGDASDPMQMVLSSKESESVAGLGQRWLPALI